METAYQEQWLTHDKQVVIIDHRAHRLQVRVHNGIYPYPHTTLSVMAEAVDKDAPAYRMVKAQLGDDWMVDVLHGSEALTVSVMRQVGF
jgi:hypothetical protein